MRHAAEMPSGPDLSLLRCFTEHMVEAEAQLRAALDDADDLDWLYGYGPRPIAAIKALLAFAGKEADAVAAKSERRAATRP